MSILCYFVLDPPMIFIVVPPKRSVTLERDIIPNTIIETARAVVLLAHVIPTGALVASVDAALFVEDPVVLGLSSGIDDFGAAADVIALWHGFDGIRVWGVWGLGS